MPSLRALTLILLGGVACLVGADRGDPDTAPPPQGGSEAAPRWMHRYVLESLDHYRPSEDRWKPEPEVPRGVVTEPGMVIWEVTEYPPGSEPTPEQARTAADLVERCYAAALRHGWQDYARGLADGYRKIDSNHHRKDEFMLDEHVLNPDRPEVLMYYPTPPDGEQRLTGFMFYARDRKARGPQIGGPLTIWHYHTWLRPQCVVDGLAVNWSVDGKCKRGVPSQYSGEMMHVWLIDHPAGPFATPMYLSHDVLMRGLAKRREERGF